MHNDVNVHIHVCTPNEFWIRLPDFCGTWVLKQLNVCPLTPAEPHYSYTKMCWQFGQSNEKKKTSKTDRRRNEKIHQRNATKSKENLKSMIISAEGRNSMLIVLFGSLSFGNISSFRKKKKFSVVPSRDDMFDVRGVFNLNKFNIRLQITRNWLYQWNNFMNCFSSGIIIQMFSFRSFLNELSNESIQMEFVDHTALPIGSQQNKKTIFFRILKYFEIIMNSIRVWCETSHNALA